MATTRSAPASPADGADAVGGALQQFSPATRAWFETSFREPTAAQTGAWLPIAAGDHTLLCAPTGSGKTLAACLWASDSLGQRPQAT
ncbi:hypothetical protein BH10ACT3_BH10ACT3_16270 [soil metagenome]